MINVYHIAEDKMTTKPVLDICQINKNGCEHGCEFDETTLEFTCTCPYGEILDMTNPKRCITLLGSENGKSAEDTQGRDFTVLEVNTSPITTKMVPEKENPTTEPAQHSEHTFDWTETHHRMPETTTETENDVNFSHIFGHSTEKLEESEAMKPDSSEENPAPEPEPKPEPEPTAEPEPKPELEPTSEPEPKSDPEPKPESEPTAEPEPKSESEPEPKSEPEPVAEPEPTPEPAPEPEPEPKSEPEPTSEPEPESKTQFDSPPQPEPTPEPKSEPEPEPEVASTTPSLEHIALNPAFMLREEHTLESEPAAEPQPEPEPTIAPMAESSPEANTQASQSISQTLENVAGHESAVITEESNITVADTNHQSEHQMDQLDNSDEKSILYTNEGKFEFKPTEDSTRRISLSEPNLINEPLYEPKPEIISILSGNQKNNSEENRNNTNDETRTTTEINDWLEQQYHDSAASVDHSQTEFEELLNNNDDKISHESEQRSFKSFDDDFLFETTTASVNPVNENDSLDLDNKDIVNPSTETTRTEDETKMPVSILPISEEAPETNTKTVSTTVPTAMETSTGETEKDNEESKTVSMITSILEEAKSIETNETVPIEITTSEPETIKQISINNHYQDTDGDKLLEVLGTKPHSENNGTSTEREPEESMDITFDAINMLYNRSSKSIEKKPDMQDTTEVSSDTMGNTTDSDWLSETVTEINYDEAMNKMANHETTESSLSKIDEIMNHGQVKDDFEPDYLSNMGSGGNKQEQEEPLYGMVHYYDNEDTRFKRVNTEVTTVAAANVTAIDAEKNISEVIVNTNAPIETTTVSEYIYKKAEESTNAADVTLSEHKEMEANISSSPVMEAEPPAVNNNEPAVSTTEEPELAMKAEPAPVWEDSNSEKYLTVKELSKKIEATTENQDPVMPSSTSEPTTIVPMNEHSKNTTMTDIGNLDHSQNTTQLSNLNVTIYEISSSNSGNNSVLLAKPGNVQSAEYDDHEPEMNPFLPEVENNKSLVKKLQEGHDLEPNNLTETQNENTEEHAIKESEGLMSSNNNSLAVIGKEAETATNINKQEETQSRASEDDTSFNELLMSGNKSDINTTPAPKSEPENKEPLPISKFLLDTDDLESSTTTISSNNADTIPVPNNDGGFLNVVPIEDQKDDLLEQLEQQKGENNAELNDISDLTKSDKRTLDATKFDSVIDNEA